MTSNIRYTRQAAPVLAALIAGCVLFSCSQPKQVVDEDLSRFFVGVDGTFVLLDPQHDVERVYNRGRAETRLLPASTFKIANALIALESGVATGPELTLQRDTVVAPAEDWWPENWREDQTLHSALQNSVVWYYQEIARRVGEERMQEYLHRFEYGNEDMGGGLDQFWLRGNLRISPLEQARFVQRLHSGQLAASEGNAQAVTEMMVLEERPGYRLGAKTGTANLTSTTALAWLVGYVEIGEAVYYFALNVEGDGIWEDWPPARRVETTHEILEALGIEPGPAS